MTKTQIIQLTDWREQGKLEYRSDFGGWCSRSEFSTHEKFENYRIKPTPTLRPWQPEEVPVGAWIRNKTAHETGHTDFASIIGVTAKSFYTVEDVFEDMEISLEKSIKYVYSLDHGKTWLPCGVLE